MNAALIRTLEMMRAELESHMLAVALAPAPRPMHAGHCVRVKVDQNPLWYRRLCAEFPSARRRRNPRPDTRIRRRETIIALDRLARTGGEVRFQYDERLLAAARAYYRQNRAALAA